MDLVQKVLIITGASSGIGAALARQASKAGARVVLAARRRSELQAVADACPGPKLIITTDITDSGQRKDLVRETVQAWGRIDVLINNAGLGAYGPFLETEEGLWRQLIEVNLLGQVFLTRLVLPLMLEQQSGLILNMGSIASLLAHAQGVVPYVATKHALLGFSRALSKEFEGTNVRVQTACPHLTDTEFFAASSGSAQMEPLLSKYRSLMDSPQEVAQGILKQLGTEQPIIFPTAKTERIFRKQRDI